MVTFIVDKKLERVDFFIFLDIDRNSLSVSLGRWLGVYSRKFYIPHGPWESSVGFSGVRGSPRRCRSFQFWANTVSRVDSTRKTASHSPRRRRIRSMTSFLRSADMKARSRLARRADRALQVDHIDVVGWARGRYGGANGNSGIYAVVIKAIQQKL